MSQRLLQKKLCKIILEQHDLLHVLQDLPESVEADKVADIMLPPVKTCRVEPSIELAEESLSNFDDTSQLSIKTELSDTGMSQQKVYIVKLQM